MKLILFITILLIFGLSPLSSSDIEKKAIKTISTGIAAPLFMLADNTVREFFQDNKGECADNIFLVSNQFGELHVNLGLAGAIYLTGSIADRTELKTTGIYLIESTLITTISISALKSIFGRSRPYLDEGSMKFNFFKSDDPHMSFPSGHSGLAFSLATIISHRINTTPAYIISYSLAAMTMMSRIYLDRHWLSDTFLGAVMGTASGMLILYLNENDTQAQKLKQAEPVSLPLINLSLSF